MAGDGSQPNRDVRSAPRTRNRHPAAPSTTHGHTDEDADEDDPDAAADADDGSDSGGGERPPKRVALAFYGLTRSLHYTIDSIRDNIFAPLKEAGYEYDVFLHTYDLARLEGRRSRESAVLNTTEWRLLQPDYVEVANQVRATCGLRVRLGALSAPAAPPARQNASATPHMNRGPRAHTRTLIPAASAVEGRDPCRHTAADAAHSCKAAARVQDKFLRDHYLPIQACKTFHTNGAKSASTRDFYNDGWQSVNNLLCQLNSISQVRALRHAPRSHLSLVRVSQPVPHSSQGAQRGAVLTPTSGHASWHACSGRTLRPRDRAGDEHVARHARPVPRGPLPPPRHALQLPRARPAPRQPASQQDLHRRLPSLARLQRPLRHGDAARRGRVG